MNAKDNGAMPAMPMPGVYDASRDQINPVDAYYSAGGLTKREEFAKAVLQGMGHWVPLDSDVSIDWSDIKSIHAARAVWSVGQADALLAELAKEPA